MRLTSSNRRWAGAGLAGVLLLTGLVSVGAPGAGAATTVKRFADPNGSGTACTKDHPCDIIRAVQYAPAGADVVVLPGKYGTAIAPVSQDIFNDATGVVIHGLAGKPAPTITSSAAEVMSIADATVKHLRLVQVGDGDGLVLHSALANQVVVVGGSPAACEIYGGSLFNSLCVSEGGAAVRSSVYTNTAVSRLRNVTAVGTGSATDGILCEATVTGGECSMQVVNSIADGATGGVDVSAQAVSGGTASLAIFSSAFFSATESGGGTEQITADDNCITDPPVYVDSGHLNFREAKSSPTIDAGLNSGADKTGDPDGLPRVLGKAVDMGAYELPPRPVVRDVKVIERRRHALLLKATVLTKKLPTAVRPVAQHGATSVRGRRKLLDGSSDPTTVKLLVDQLKRHTTYDVTVTATNVGGKASDSAQASTR